MVYLPFENRRIPAPAGYDGRLKQEYGDYMKPAKAPTMHGSLFLIRMFPMRSIKKTTGEVQKSEAVVSLKMGIKIPEICPASARTASGILCYLSPIFRNIYIGRIIGLCFRDHLLDGRTVKGPRYI